MTTEELLKLTVETLDKKKGMDIKALKVTPAPFCIFDEVEAALDDVNVSRYAQYVRRMTQNTPVSYTHLDVYKRQE